MSRHFKGIWASKEIWLHKEKKGLKVNSAPSISTFIPSTSSAKIEQKGSSGEFTQQEAL